MLFALSMFHTLPLPSPPLPGGALMLLLLLLQRVVLLLWSRSRLWFSYCGAAPARLER